MPTLDEIRRATAALVDPYYHAGTATGGSSTSLVEDTAYPVRNSRRGQWWLDGYVLRPGTTSVSPFEDAFDRTSATTLGTSDSGTAWNSPIQGTWGTDGSAAYAVTNNDADLVTAPMLLNGTLTCRVYGTLALLGAYSVPMLVVRQDSSSTGKYLLVAIWRTIARLYKVSGGVTTALTTITGLNLADATYHELGLVLNGNALGLFVNGQYLGSYTLTGGDAAQYGAANANATYHGLALKKLGSPSYAARWDDLSFTSFDTTDRIRWISADTQSSGQLSVTPAYTVAPAVGEPYELYSVFAPEQIEAAANRALNRMMTLQQTSIPGVDDQVQYDLTPYPWITHKDDARRLRVLLGTTALQYRERDVRDWEVKASGGVLTLNLWGEQFSAADTLLLRTQRSYGSIRPLLWSTDVTTAPLDWVAAETAYELYSTPLALRAAVISQGEWSNARAEAWRRVQNQRSMYPLDDPMPLIKTRGDRYGPGNGGVLGGVT